MAVGISANGFSLARFTPNGALDTTFSGDGKSTTGFGIKNTQATGVAIQSDGNIVVAGSVDGDFALVRYEGHNVDVLISLSDNGTPSDSSDDFLAIRENYGSYDIANHLRVKRIAGDQLEITSSVVGSIIDVTNVSGATGSGSSSVQIPLSAIPNKIRFNLAKGDDSLIIDTTGGDPIPLGGVEFMGGEGRDKIDLIGTTDNLWTFTSATSGTVQVGSFGTLNLSGIEIAQGSEGSDTYKFPASAGDMSHLTSLTLNGEAGFDTIEYTAASNSSKIFNLENLWFSIGPARIALGSIEHAKLTGGAGDDSFIIHGWRGDGDSRFSEIDTRTLSIYSGGGKDLVSHAHSSVDKYFRLGSTAAFSGMEVKNTGADGVTTMLARFSGIDSAGLGSGLGATFDLSQWYLTGYVSGANGGEEKVLQISRDFTYATIKKKDNQSGSYEFLSGRNNPISLSSFDKAKIQITGGASNQRLDIGDWPGAITFDGQGGVDTLGVIRTVKQFKAVGDEANNGYLDAQTSATSALNVYEQRAQVRSVESISISANATTLDSTFDISGWNGYGEFFAGNGNDKIVSDKSAATFTQADVTLSDGLLKQVTKSNVADATAITRTIKLGGVDDMWLMGGASPNTYDLSGWSGAGAINAGAGIDRVVSSKNIDQALTNGSLITGARTWATAGAKTIWLNGVESATLSVAGATGRTINAGTFTLGSVSLTGNAGNDMLIGGSQADIISGQSGDDVLVGNGGDDTIHGAEGRDILVGGGGSDTINGGAGEDLLIGGHSYYHGHVVALDAFFAAWADTTATYAARITKLTSTGVGPGNDYKLLQPWTVQNDSAVDTFVGGADLDWFWSDTPGTETLGDRIGTETASDVA